MLNEIIIFYIILFFINIINTQIILELFQKKNLIMKKPLGKEMLAPSKMTCAI